MTFCIVEGCDSGGKLRRGLCLKHYTRWYRTGSTDAPEPRPSPIKKMCSVDGCERDVRGRGYCHLHYDRWYRTGELGPPDKLQPIPAIERLFEYLALDENGCWLFTGNIDEFIYARAFIVADLRKR